MLLAKKQQINVGLPNSKQKGFTLLELLIASIIFAIMALMAYGGLDNVIRNSQSSQQSLDRLKRLQKSISILNRDFLQILPRNIRDEYGTVQPYLDTRDNPENIISFTRGGRVNPANLPRSSLQRIAYRLEDEKLVRLQWRQLDSAPNDQPRRSVILDEVESVKLRFLDKKAKWSTVWPPTTSATPTKDIPSAIEFVILLKDWGNIRRVFATK